MPFNFSQGLVKGLLNPTSSGVRPPSSRPSSSRPSSSRPSSSRPSSTKTLGYGLYVGHLVTIWGIAASNAFLGLMILWTGREVGQKRLAWRWKRDAPLLAPLGVVVILLFVSVAFSHDPKTSSEHLREIFTYVTLAFALILVRGEGDVRRAFDLIILMITLLAATGIAQYAFTDFGTLHKRITGPFSHYQTFSGILLIGNLLLLARIVSGQGWKRPLNWLALLLINTTLFLTLTRGPWVVASITVTIYILLRARRYFLHYVAAALVATLVVVLLVPDFGQRIRSIADLRDPSNYDRLCMLQAGFHMVTERPLFGIGPGMVKELYPIYRHPTAPRLTVPHLHNSFAELAAERGLTSLAAYFWLMAAAFILAIRAYRQEGGPHGRRADLYVGVILVLVGFNLAGLFEDNWRDTEVQRLVLFLMATPICLGMPERAAESSHPPALEKE